MVSVSKPLREICFRFVQKHVSVTNSMFFVKVFSVIPNLTNQTTITPSYPLRVGNECIFPGYLARTRIAIPFKGELIFVSNLTKAKTYD